MAYLDENGLEYVLDKLSTEFDKKSNTGHTHDDRYYSKAQVDSAINVAKPTIDSSLSTTSTNPVQNKAITNWLGNNVKDYALQVNAETINGNADVYYLSLTSSGVSTIAPEVEDGSSITYGHRIYAVDDSLSGKRHKFMCSIDLPNNVPVSDNDGNLINSNISETELGYLDGVTSNIQTQLNNKAASSHNHSASNITSGTLAVARGGTGLTSSPSMLVNLGSTSAANVLAASPRPGITGTLGLGNGGTGATSASAARTNLSVYSKAEVDEKVGIMTNDMIDAICVDPVIISFTISGTQYSAMSGMTFENWANSSYNTDGFYINEGLLANNMGQSIDAAYNEIIVNGQTYYYNGVGDGGSGFLPA